MEKCVILCRLKFKKDAHLDYDAHKTISIGPFSDHESAGDFMTECMDNDQNLKGTLNVLYSDEVMSIDHWEVADYIDTEFIAQKWTDHETARRSSAERGKFNFSQ